MAINLSTSRGKAGMTVNPFALDDSDSVRQRYTKSSVKRGDTELIQCRADAFHVRRIDEIVASRIDSTFKTRSDVMQDALAMWLEDWDQRYPDGAGGELAFSAKLRNMERKREFRNDFLESADRQFVSLTHDHDVNGLREFLQMMLQAQGNFKDDAPPSFMDKVERLVIQAKQLLEASI